VVRTFLSWIGSIGPAGRLALSASSIFNVSLLEGRSILAGTCESQIPLSRGHNPHSPRNCPPRADTDAL
jgi:hypothetical protein